MKKVFSGELTVFLQLLNNPREKCKKQSAGMLFRQKWLYTAVQLQLYTVWTERVGSCQHQVLLQSSNQQPVIILDTILCKYVLATKLTLNHTNLGCLHMFVVHVACSNFFVFFYYDCCLLWLMTLFYLTPNLSI